MTNYTSSLQRWEWSYFQVLASNPNKNIQMTSSDAGTPRHWEYLPLHSPDAETYLCTAEHYL